MILAGFSNDSVSPGNITHKPYYTYTYHVAAAGCVCASYPRREGVESLSPCSGLGEGKYVRSIVWTVYRSREGETGFGLGGQT